MNEIVPAFTNNLAKLAVGIVYLVNKLMLPHYRVIAHEGGTRSGKTYNTVWFLIDLALGEVNTQITICSRDLPHLRRGAMKDFQEIMLKRNLWIQDNWRETDHKYTFDNGAYIEFLGADDLGKVSGPGRDYLYCNEVNFFKYIVYRMLVIRTRKKVIIDYNPIHAKHWVYDKVLNKANCYMWQSTYIDNLSFLPKEQILEIQEMAITDPEWARIYVDGKRGTLQKGQIYKNWKPISLAEYKAIEARERIGIDWGYYPDPNAIVGYKWNKNKRYIRPIGYVKNQSDEDLVKMLKANGCTSSTQIVCPSDSGGGKASVYLQTHGFPLTYVYAKPAGSIKAGVKKLRELDVYYVMTGEMEFEVGNYVFELDSNDDPTGDPADKHNHYMDAIRYIELYKPYL